MAFEFEEKQIRIAAKAIHQWEMRYLGAQQDDRYWDWDKLKPYSHARYMAMARAALYAVEEEAANPAPPPPAIERTPSARAAETFKTRNRWQ